MNKRLRLLELESYLKNEKSSSYYTIYTGKNFNVINKKDFNIAGSYSSAGVCDIDLNLYAYYEYIERLACSILPNDVIKYDGLDSKSSFDVKNFGYEWTGNKFEHKKTIKGVPAKSIKGETFLVPADFVYYLNKDYDFNNYFGNSNGAALGADFEMALTNAVLEYVERDKLLRYWYNDEGTLTKISYDYLQTLDIIDKVKYYSFIGYDLTFYKINIPPNEISVIWCLMRSTKKENKLYSFSGFAADLNIDSAIKKSLKETISFYSARVSMTNTVEIDEHEILNKNILSLDDNIHYYFSYSRDAEFNELLENVEVDSGSNNITNNRSCIEIVEQHYGNIFYVSLNNGLLEDLDLSLVRVFLPNSYNLYFGVDRTVSLKGKMNNILPLG